MQSRQTQVLTLQVTAASGSTPSGLLRGRERLWWHCPSSHGREKAACANPRVFILLVAFSTSCLRSWVCVCEASSSSQTPVQVRHTLGTTPLGPKSRWYQ